MYHSVCLCTEGVVTPAFDKEGGNTLQVLAPDSPVASSRVLVTAGTGRSKCQSVSQNICQQFHLSYLHIKIRKRLEESGGKKCDGASLFTENHEDYDIYLYFT